MGIPIRTRNYHKRENLFGRRVYFTDEESITRKNVVEVLNKALVYHNINRSEIEYLDNYYRGDQPILYRVKKVRPEINNKIVENFALDAVNFHTAQNYGEPIQYVNASPDKDISKEINMLNSLMRLENKAYWDIELGTWQNIAGTAYRFVLPDRSANIKDSECPFTLDVLDPRFAFVVYSKRIGKKAAMGVRIIENEKDGDIYECYTRQYRWRIQGGKIIQEKINPLNAIPIIEYPKNSRRMGVIEMTITITDAMNTATSNRLDGIEQFIQAFMKFVNCKIDKDKFLEMVQLGAVTVKGEPGLPADVDVVSSQLDQSQTQVTKDDLYKSYLIVQGMPSREQNTGGDTGSAVYLRNGWDFAEKREEIGEPIDKKSEMEFLKVVTKILRNYDILDIQLKDIDVNITRNKTDNMLVKSQALQILLDCGVDDETALAIVQLFSDPQKVYAKSKDRMQNRYDSKFNKDIGGGNIAIQEKGTASG